MLVKLAYSADQTAFPGRPPPVVIDAALSRKAGAT
jgi:hypothetical protein